MTKNYGVNNYKYSGYAIRFDGHGSFSYPGIGVGKNVIVFGVYMSSSTRIDNRKKYILILVKGPTQGPEYTLHAEKMYSINLLKTTRNPV